MSLSLSPAPTSDRTTAEVRVSQSAEIANSRDKLDQDAIPGEFAALVNAPPPDRLQWKQTEPGPVAIATTPDATTITSSDTGASVTLLDGVLLTDAQLTEPPQAKQPLSEPVSGDADSVDRLPIDAPLNESGPGELGILSAIQFQSHPTAAADDLASDPNMRATAPHSMSGSHLAQRDMGVGLPLSNEPATRPEPAFNPPKEPTDTVRTVPVIGVPIPSGQPNDPVDSTIHAGTWPTSTLAVASGQIGTPSVDETALSPLSTRSFDGTKLNTSGIGGAISSLEPVRVLEKAVAEPDLIASRTGQTAQIPLPDSGNTAAQPPGLTAQDMAKTLSQSSTPVRLGHPQLFAAYGALANPVQSAAGASSRATLAPKVADGTNDLVQSGLTPRARVINNGDLTPAPSDQSRQSGTETSTTASKYLTAVPTRLSDLATSPVSMAANIASTEVAPTETSGPTLILPDMLRFDPVPNISDAAQSGPLGRRATAVHVASQLAQAAGQIDAGTTDITLNPRELGQVKLSLQAVDGTMFVNIAAERPETAELMRRHIDSLAQEFRGLGYQDVSFSFSGRHGGNGSGPDPGFGQRANSEPEQSAATNTDLPADRYIPRRTAAQTGGTGLDLRL